MSDREERQEGKGFKVQDRRRFSETGELRPENAETKEEDAAPQGAAASEAQAPASGATQESAPPLELNFSTFLISLSTQALAHLGEIPNPIDRKTAIDLSAARQLIDILGILKDKTKGNLDSTEEQLLDHALYDLRLKYVERSQGKSGNP
jgi:hypothetical protein